MKYRAKECFMIVDGTGAGTSYTRGAVYDSMPSGYEFYFDEIKQEANGIKPESVDVKATLIVEPKQEPYIKPVRAKTPAPETGCVKPKDEKEQITPNSEEI